MCISGTCLLGQIHTPPHWDRSWASAIVSHPQRSDAALTSPGTDPVMPGRVATKDQFSSHWYDLTPVEDCKSRTSGCTDPRKKVGLDWPYPQEDSQQHHQAVTWNPQGKRKMGRPRVGMASPSGSQPATSPARLWPGIHRGRPRVGLASPSGSQPATSAARLWPGIHRGRDSGEDPGPHGTETLK